MKLLKVFIAAVALLLPMSALAEYINIYPGPDEDWNYLYDFGDVEVGSSAVMIFQIENEEGSPSSLFVSDVYIEDATGPFVIVDSSVIPALLSPGESVYVEVVFSPGDEGFFEGVMRIFSNASNDPPGTVIYYGLQGMGVGYEPPPGELMALVMGFYAEGLADGSIYGLGNGNAQVAHERVFGNMLDAADDLIAAGDYAAACSQLEHAALKSDGMDAPPDFMGGPGVSSLNSMLIDIMVALGC